MNKNLFNILCLLFVFNFTYFFASEPPKVSLKEVFAAAKLPQPKFNKFWFNFYDFEQDRINNLLAIKKNSTEEKLESVSLINSSTPPDLSISPNTEDTLAPLSTSSSTPPEIFNKKIKNGILYCLPTLTSAGISLYGLYCANKNLYDDSSGLKNLFYSCALSISAGYYCLNYTLPSFKKGMYSLLYKSIWYNDHLKNKQTTIKNSLKKIEDASTDKFQK